MPALVKVAVTSGSNVYICKAPKDYYTGPVATATKITQTIPTTEVDEPIITVPELIRVGKVQRISVVYEKLGKRRRLEMLCASDKADTIKNELKGKTVNSGTIVDVVNKRDASFY
jgi:hypothetical protein